MEFPNFLKNSLVQVLYESQVIKLNILIENGTYDCHNAGDLSMLKVCIERVIKKFPNSNVLTVSEAPISLKLISDKTTPVSLLKGKVVWLQERNLFGPMHRFMPIKDESINNYESSIRREFKSFSLKLISYRLNKNSSEYLHLKDYMDTLESIDIAIVSGGGFITDSFETHAIRLLETIYLILKSGKKVAFFGQGIGPINSPKLEALARKVFPLVDIFALREPNKGPALLKRLGVHPNQIVITGDDAIELAATGRESSIGEHIGFNIRISSYAAVESNVSKQLVDILLEKAKVFNTSIIPVPISWHEKDLDYALELLNLNRDNSDFDDLETIEGLIKQTSKCKVVVTGSYHAAVFALAQGIPVIAIANSEYYADKFNGLSTMFKDGLKIIVLGQSNWVAIFNTYINEFWNGAENLRESLRIQADGQIKLSKQAYEDFFKLIDNSQ